MSSQSATKDRPSSSHNASADENNLDSLNTSITAKEAPYGTDYAKSGRAKCKACHEPIEKGVLRMAVRFQSKFFDGFQENWHHYECFWGKTRKNDINEASIRGMEWLKWSDQEQIRQRIEELKSSETGGYTPKPAEVKVEHAKSGAGKCFECKEKIEKGQLRISSKASFHHVKCFANQNSFQKSADELVGYEELDDGEKAQLDKMFTKKQNGAEKRKLESEEENGDAGYSESQTPAKKSKEGDDKKMKKKLKKQSEILWATRQALKDNVNKENMEMLLKLNGGYKSKKDGFEGVVDKLVDMIVYGPPEKCPECGGGQLSYKTNIHAYKCSGNVSDYASCLYTTRNPERAEFYIPKDMKKENEYLKKLQSPMLSERVYPAGALEEVMTGGSKAFKKLDVVSRFESNSKGKSGTSSGDSQKMVVKHGNVVDPKCTVATTTHVYVDPEKKRPWQANLSAMDISTGRNSYYKLQIVKDDHAEKFYLFRAWGRVGTVSGGSKTDNFGKNLEECKSEFEHHFHDKTQNTWEDYMEGNFKKVPRGMDVLEVDFSSKKVDKKMQKLDVSASKSNLPLEVKELISMVFDINALTDTMKEFEIDMEKMPLGRLSRDHILRAYNVLTELQQVLEKQQSGKEDADKNIPKHQFIDFTNRFYTLIPHAMGLANPPLLNNSQILREKTQMLDSLLEIEIAFNILKTDYEQIDGKDVFDMHYEQLKCSMEVLNHNSDEFGLIKRYLDNTHALTHDIQLEIVNVLKIEREAEMKRFKKEIGNRHLLWHGSRLSNYAGILSQGLRIAPPEAPVTGYMFGKGIYTADMVTKSANYCYTMDGEGLLLLCDVALGEMQLEKDGKDIKKPRRGKHSVKGIGGTVPNPAECEHFNGMAVPCGKPIKSKEKDLTLLYNEYIVYDEAQIQLRYICRVKFNNKLML